MITLLMCRAFEASAYRKHVAESYYVAWASTNVKPCQYVIDDQLYKQVHDCSRTKQAVLATDAI